MSWLGRGPPPNAREGRTADTSLDTEINGADPDGMGDRADAEAQGREVDIQPDDWSGDRTVPNPGDDLVLGVRANRAAGNCCSVVPQFDVRVVPRDSKPQIHQVVLV